MVTRLDNRIIDRLDQVWCRFVDSGTLVGGVLLLAWHGRLIYACARGWADREAGIRSSRLTIFRWASLTKLVTAVTILRLHEHGIVSLDAPVTCWLPGFLPKLADGTTPTIRLSHLLSHTSGLYYGFERPAGNPYHQAGISDGLDNGGIGLDENLRRLSQVPLLFVPGSAWQYSIATDVLGAVIERACGLPLANAIAYWVLKPLALGDTGFHHQHDRRLSAAYCDGASIPFRVGGNDRLNIDTGVAYLSAERIANPNAYPSGGAGLAGTAEDYLKLLECLRCGGAPLLKPESTRMLLSNAIGDISIPSRGPGWKFGLGPLILTDPAQAGQPQGAGTWSWCGLFGSHYWVDPESGLTMIAMTNTGIAGAWGPFADAILTAIYG